MDDLIFALLCSMLDEVEGVFELTMKDGSKKTVQLDIEKVKARLSDCLILEKEADWLADSIVQLQQLDRHDGTDDAAVCKKSFWREAARKAVEAASIELPHPEMQS